MVKNVINLNQSTLIYLLKKFMLYLREYNSLNNNITFTFYVRKSGFELKIPHLFTTSEFLNTHFEPKKQVHALNYQHNI
jgi:hypothetical protein